MRGNKLVTVVVNMSNSKLDALLGQESTHYTEDSNVDCCHYNSRAPFQPPDDILSLANDGYPVDDDLHENLDLKNPAEQDEEQHDNTVDTKC